MGIAKISGGQILQVCVRFGTSVLGFSLSQTQIVQTEIEIKWVYTYLRVASNND